MFDGYDCGVLYSDQHIGYILNALADQNLLEETAIIISADHGSSSCARSSVVKVPQRILVRYSGVWTSDSSSQLAGDGSMKSPARAMPDSTSRS